MSSSEVELTRAVIGLKIDNEKDLLPEFKKMAELVAKKQRAYYEALIEQGFEERQALELVEESCIHKDLVYFTSEDGEVEK